jgi:hypothetical protein
MGCGSEYGHHMGHELIEAGFLAIQMATLLGELSSNQF